MSPGALAADAMPPTTARPGCVRASSSSRASTGNVNGSATRSSDRVPATSVGKPLICQPWPVRSASRRTGSAGEPSRAANSETPGVSSTSRLAPSTATAAAPSRVTGCSTERTTSAMSTDGVPMRRRHEEHSQLRHRRRAARGPGRSPPPPPAPSLDAPTAPTRSDASSASPSAPSITSNDPPDRTATPDRRPVATESGRGRCSNSTTSAPRSATSRRLGGRIRYVTIRWQPASPTGR